jgi:beta-glucosidase
VALFAAVLPLTMSAAAGRAAGSTPIYLDTSYSFAERAADLDARMTLAQKASEMNSSQAAAISGLGISTYGWWNEAAHGVSCETLSAANCTSLTNTTSYPVSLSAASSWDPALVNQEASLISDEAREVETNNTLNMDFYAPVVNLIRDPRWGRTDETWSEDPFLEGKVAGQFVNGMQGQDVDGNLLPAGDGYAKTIATIKHFTANNSEVNRLNGSSDMDDRTLREYYTWPYRNISQEAHVGSIMSSYNRVNGTPSPASVYLTDTLARETFGFGGYFTSDCDAIYEIQAGHHWLPPNSSTAVTAVTRHAYALSAGEDLDCNKGYNDGQSYASQLPAAVGAGITTLTGHFTENELDVAVERLMTARMKLGEFDAANNLVPWVNQARQRVPQGSWMNNDTNNAVTETPERLAMARKVGAQSIVLLKNSTTTRKDGSVGKLLPLHVPATGTFNVAVIGYFANPATMYLGDYSSSQSAHGIANQVTGYIGLKNAIQAINPNANVDFLPGVVGGTSASQLTTVDPASVNAAAAYDAAIVYVGTDASTGQEAQDRTNLSLPGAQASLISQVAAKNPNTIVYMETDGPVDVTSFEPNVSALLWSSFNGMRKGESLADDVLGVYNPSGRLPFTWYQNASQLPLITNYAIRPSGTTPGRTYMYFHGPVSYPFGYGLSYSNFTYSNLQIDKQDLDASDTFQVNVDVTNTSATAGNDVVELYATTPDAPVSLERPAKRLRGFQKIFLNAGGTKTVTLTVRVPDLAFFDQSAGRWVVDDGRYGIQVADSSGDADVRQQGFVQVSGSLTQVPTVVTVKATMQGDAAADIPQRLIFPQGAVVVPNTTVATNDDTLYGYITKNGSKPFPNGMTISYASNRPWIVSIDSSGLIRTRRAGVATLTATASYNGVSKTGSFVVYVQQTDTAAPVTTASLAPGAVNGWYSNPTVTLSASDDSSGIDYTEYSLEGGAWTTYMSPFQVTGDGDHTLAYRSADYAGNVETTQSLDFKVDGTPPTINITSPADGASYTLNSKVTASYSCADTTSEIDSCTGTTTNGAAVDTSSVGRRTYTVNARDQAGNTNTKTSTYTVTFPFSGFFAPVKNPPTLNVLQAGKQVPVRFSLGGNYGLGIFAAGYPQSQQISCNAQAATNMISTAATSSGLAYDAKSNRYTYTWKTDKSWANTCRQFTLKLTDTTVHNALFKFTK